MQESAVLCLVKMKDPILILARTILCTVLSVGALSSGFAQGTWVWKNGATTLGQASNFGTIGVPAPSNQPGGRYECAEWTDLNGDLWLYGGGLGLVRYSGLWKFDTATELWTFMHGNTVNNAPAVYGTQGISDPNNTPGGNGFAAATWTDPSGDLWLYGGEDGADGYNDLWKFDIALNEWTWVHGAATASTPPTYGTQGISSPFNTPGVRMETSCTWVDNTGDLWLFGGSLSGPGDIRNDLWRYNIASNEWTWMKGTNGSGAAGVYGTMGVSAAANTPGGRWCYTSWKDAQGDLWLFGGVDAGSIIGMAMFNDLWKYTLATNEWTWMAGSNSLNSTGNYGTQCTPSPNNQPPARGETRSRWTDKCGKFWLYGGRTNGFDYFNDLWRYDPITNEWAWISGSSTPNQTGVYGTVNVAAPGNVPGARMGAVGWVNEQGLWLFGGENAGEFNDLWLYMLDSIHADFSFSQSANCDEFDFVDQSTFGCDEINSYSWNFGDPASGVSNTDTLQNPSHIFSGSGVYPVSLIIENCAGGSDTLVQNVTVICGINVTVAPDSICIGDCTNLLANAQGGLAPYTFQWDNGITNTTAGPIPVCPNTSTNYAVIVTDQLGAMDTAVVTINVFTPLLVDLGPDTTLCAPPLLLDAGVGNYTYVWQDGSNAQTFQVDSAAMYWVELSNGVCTAADTVLVSFSGPVVDLGPDTVSCFPTMLLDAGSAGMTYLWQDASFSATFTTTGPGTFWVQVTDVNGCTASDTISILLDNPQVNLGPDQVLCAGATVLLDAGLAWSNYIWQNGSNLSTYTLDTSGTYWVDVSLGQCVDQDSVSVLLYQPEALPLVNDTIGCPPLLLQFTDASSTPSGTITSWQWLFGDGGTSNLQHPSYIYQQAGTYQVSLSVMTSDGCSDTAFIQPLIHVHPSPEAQFQFDPTTAQLIAATIQFTDYSNGAVQWAWSFGDGSSSTDQNPTHTYGEAGTFTVVLQVTNAFGCVSTISYLLTITETASIYIPNAFTPNDDGINDMFFVQGVGITELELMIFNRWGELIFTSNNIAQSWDATYAGRLVQDGVYVYKVNYRSSDTFGWQRLFGHVTVIK